MKILEVDIQGHLEKHFSHKHYVFTAINRIIEDCFIQNFTWTGWLLRNTLLLHAYLDGVWPISGWKWAFVQGQSLQLVYDLQCKPPLRSVLFRELSP